MKRIISSALSALIFLSLPMMALANQIKTCTVTADSLPTVPGSKITIPVRIAENQGFTNFAIALEYDHKSLELLSINTGDGETQYLCGSQFSTNIAWENDQKPSCGFLVSASKEAVTGDGILFTATFQTKESLSEYTTVTPVVQYIRNNAAVFSVFEEIKPTVTESVITVVVPGDVNGDGVVEYDDVMCTYQVSIAENNVFQDSEQMLRADLDGDGFITERDVKIIYQIYTGGV